MPISPISGVCTFMPERWVVCSACLGVARKLTHLRGDGVQAARPRDYGGRVPVRARPDNIGR